jgi:thiopurine S-methyltransferase
MEADYWTQRWRENRIGFHREQVMPLLEKHWHTLALPTGSRVLVPLAGKSLDMVWLAAQGHRVLGVELSPLAVTQFFEEHGLAPEVHDSAYGRHHLAGNLELLCGDAFQLSPALLADCAGAYDRGALIALPPDMRRQYVETLYAALPSGCQALLITLEYPQAEKNGPPFSVEEAEVRQLFGPHWQVELLERRDILHQQPDFSAEGVTALATAIYRLEKRA